MDESDDSTVRPWPTVPWRDWADTVETLHLMSQVVGKVRLVRSPWINHSWAVPLYLSPRGFRTSLVPDGAAGFELEFDLLDHVVRADHHSRCSRSQWRSRPPPWRSSTARFSHCSMQPASG